MIDIYLASRWSRQPELRQIRDHLHEWTKYRVVSSWIDTVRPDDLTENFFMSYEGQQRLLADLSDIKKSDVVVADILGGFGRRGGMLIEIGYAVGLGKSIILIGNPAECGIFGNIFDRTFPDWPAAFRNYF